MKTLKKMLTYKRPHNSESEREFLARFVANIPGIKKDVFGNLYVQIGDSDTLYSCHVDTVHKDSGRQDIYQIDDLIVSDGKNVLGADCAAGVWLLRKLIYAKKPGLYVFHRAEEIGGKGSLAFRKEHNLSQYSRAIAFDRRGKGDVITYQSGDRCCSDKFGLALANALNLDHTLSPHGSFTDTAIYTGDIGECTNVSVGYDDEHTASESVDLEYLSRLFDAVLHADIDALPTERKPGDSESYWGDWAHDWKGFNDLATYDELEQLFFDGNRHAVEQLIREFGISYLDIVDVLRQ